MFRPLTPLEFKRRAVRLFGRKVGVVDGQRRFTYAELGERTDRLANALLERGLQRGQRVALLAFNSHPLLEAYYGVLEAGGILMPLNIRLSAAELTRILSHAEPSFLLVDQELAKLADSVLAGISNKPTLAWIGARPAGSDEPEYEEMLAAASTAPPPPLDIDENDVAEIFYTSGTTGRPRGVMLTHRNLYLHAMGALVTFRAAESDVQLHTIALFHVNGWGTPQFMTAVGGRHVMMRKFDAAEAVKLVEAEGVTRLLVVPTMLNAILELPDLGRYDLSSLQLVNSGGAPTPLEMVRDAEKRLGCKVAGGYGLTETCPLISLALEKSYLTGDGDDVRVRRRASTGLPVIGTEITILDREGEELSWNGRDVGEVVVRSNVVTKGYYLDDQATEAAMAGDWFRTGDLATIDPEGYLQIVDRKKDIIISGGENIASVEIEEVLYEHPAVLECAVVAIPDDKWGEVPGAVIALKPGTSATEQELKAHCRSRLARFKTPKVVDFMRELPKGGTGKVLKRVLRERYWQGHEKRVK